MTIPRNLLYLALSGLVLLGAGCRDKEREAAERAAVESRIAEREAKVAKVKAEATRRVAEKLLDVRPYDQLKARNRLVREKYGIDLEKTELCSKEDTRSLLEARAIGVTDELYPPSTRDALVEQVAKEFPMYKIGDQVAVSTRTNRGASGTIESITSSYVKVGPTKILIADITAPDPVCFDSKACEKQRRFIVHKNFDAPRRDELDVQRKRLLPIVMRECGYVSANNQWRRVDEFLKPVIEPLVKKEEAAYLAAKEEKLRKDVETELLAEGLLPLPPPVKNPYTEKE